MTGLANFLYTEVPNPSGSGLAIRAEQGDESTNSFLRSSQGAKSERLGFGNPSRARG
ncbi:hypothetical protein QUF72_03920 [Desulfobacterales bacterium HSG2]|nr:hypothetical protein [Desulfobacterales bacterium HSG2]